MQLCVEKDLHNNEGDALSCLYTAVSKQFKYDHSQTIDRKQWVGVVITVLKGKLQLALEMLAKQPGASYCV